MTGAPHEPSRTPLDCDYIRAADVCTDAKCVHTAQGPEWTGRPQRHALVATLALLAALSLGAALSLVACGSSGSSTADSSAASVKTTMTAGVPKDASSEPPWNGRFVQVNVTTAKPGAMRAQDWHVSVNGKEPELDKPASILPYSPHGAMVAFVFRAPYTDLGTYKFDVAYAPKDGPKVERSWDYKW